MYRLVIDGFFNASYLPAKTIDRENKKFFSNSKYLERLEISLIKLTKLNQNLNE